MQWCDYYGHDHDHDHDDDYNNDSIYEIVELFSMENDFVILNERHQKMIIYIMNYYATSFSYSST